MNSWNGMDDSLIKTMWIFRIWNFETISIICINFNHRIIVIVIWLWNFCTSCLNISLSVVHWIEYHCVHGFNHFISEFICLISQFNRIRTLRSCGIEKLIQKPILKCPFLKWLLQSPKPCLKDLIQQIHNHSIPLVDLRIVPFAVEANVSDLIACSNDVDHHCLVLVIEDIEQISLDVNCLNWRGRNARMKVHHRRPGPDAGPDAGFRCRGENEMAAVDYNLENLHSAVVDGAMPIAELHCCHEVSTKAFLTWISSTFERPLPPIPISQRVAGCSKLLTVTDCYWLLLKEMCWFQTIPVQLLIASCLGNQLYTLPSWSASSHQARQPSSTEARISILQIRTARSQTSDQLCSLNIITAWWSLLQDYWSEISTGFRQSHDIFCLGTLLR
jgi:hypothetical protein